MNVKTLHRNILPSQACAAATTYTSAPQQALAGAGVRLFVTISGATAGSTADSLQLCAVPPAGGNPIPLAGVSKTGGLSTNGTYIFDFYPSASLPSPATGWASVASNLASVAGIYLPMNWAIQITMGTGASAAVVIDAEILP